MLSELGLHGLSWPFWQATSSSVQNFKTPYICNKMGKNVIAVAILVAILEAVH